MRRLSFSGSTWGDPEGANRQKGEVASRLPSSIGPLERRKRRLAYTFIFPALFVITALYLVPTLVTFVVSFEPAKMDPNILKVFDPANLRQLSLDNYLRSFQDPVWRKAVGNTIWYVVVVLVLSIGFSMVTALVLNQSFKGRGFLRALILIPWAVPPIVNGTTWGLVYHADIGTMNGLLRSLGIIDKDLLWLGHPKLALLAVITATVWRLIPLVTLLILAGLQTIPQEIYESAKVDGANAVQRFLYITMPNVRMVLLTTATLLTVFVTKAFDEIWALTEGGPSYGTTVMNLWTYRQAFDFLRFGYGAALAYLLMFLTGIVVVANFIIRRRVED
ncbi:MAG: carbohydrate ABC transporter permease [Anaerolineae bacterium]